MKKFFALALALVMALSLTTVAWGAATALPAADANGVITLTEDVTLTFTGNAGIALADGTVIDGDGYTLTLEGNVGSYSSSAAIYNLHAGANVQIKDLVIDNNLTVGYVFSFADATLDNVDITGSTMPLALVGGAAGDEIVVKNCEFEGFVGEAISTETGAATPVIIDTCKFTGDTAVIMRNNSSSSVNSTYDADLVLYADDVAENVTGNTFNAGVNVYFSDETLTGNSFGSDATIKVKNNATDVDVSGNYWGGGAPTAAQLGGATADTYYTTNSAGTLSDMVSGGNKGTLYSADGLKTVQTTGDDFVYVPAKALSKSVTTGNVAHYFSATAGAGNVWMVVGAADAVNTDSILKIGGTEKYVRAVDADDVKYTATATEYKNIGEKCGQIVDDGFGTKYYTLKDNEGKAVDGYFVEGNQRNVLLGTAVVGMATANPTIVDHVWKEAAYDKDGYCNALKCENCPATAKLYKPGTVPAGVVSEASGYPVYELMVVKAPAAPSTDKVQSAETFDAGIAMYVGMSVMAAAGSAVVLKKRED